MAWRIDYRDVVVDLAMNLVGRTARARSSLKAIVLKLSSATTQNRGAA